MQKKWENGAVRQCFNIRARRKSKRKKVECSSNLGELVEFLSKSHDDQTEIRRKELELGEKELNIQPKKHGKATGLDDKNDGNRMMEKTFEKDM